MTKCLMHVYMFNAWKSASCMIERFVHENVLHA
jgi:hypothetical protein